MSGQVRSTSYSALPVLTSDIGPQALDPGPVLVPRMSGIPLLAGTPTWALRQSSDPNAGSARPQAYDSAAPQPMPHHHHPARSLQPMPSLDQDQLRPMRQRVYRPHALAQSASHGNLRAVSGPNEHQLPGQHTQSSRQPSQPSATDKESAAARRANYGLNLRRARATSGVVAGSAGPTATTAQSAVGAPVRRPNNRQVSTPVTLSEHTIKVDHVADNTTPRQASRVVSESKSNLRLSASPSKSLSPSKTPSPMKAKPNTVLPKKSPKSPKVPKSDTLAARPNQQSSNRVVSLQRRTGGERVARPRQASTASQHSQHAHEASTQASTQAQSQPHSQPRAVSKRNSQNSLHLTGQSPPKGRPAGSTATAPTLASMAKANTNNKQRGPPLRVASGHPSFNQDPRSKRQFSHGPAPLPRVAQMSHSQSFPTNLSQNIKPRHPKPPQRMGSSNTLSGVLESHTPPASAIGSQHHRHHSSNRSFHNLPMPRSERNDSRRPESPASVSSSRSSFYSATRKLFSALRHSSASRSVVTSSSDVPSAGPSRPASPLDEDWPIVEIDRKPSEHVMTLFREIVPFNDNLRDIDPSAQTEAVDGSTLISTPGALTEYESTEIQDYRHVYYSGPAPSRKRMPEDFSDKDGNYRPAAHDHLAYRYEIMSELGRGSFGTVFKCRDHKSGRMVAVKITANRKGLRRQAGVEAALLKKLANVGSPDLHHFVRYIDHFVFREHLCICTEFLSFNLYDMLRATHYQGLGLELARYITRQLVEGLEFLEGQGIIHCDLKPENILLSNLDQCQIKIIDFGSGCHESRKVFTYIQSRFYRAPEILLGIPYGPAIDVWSLGCIVPELILGKPLFPGEDEADQIACICEIIGAPDLVTLNTASRASVFFDSRGQPLVRRSPKGVIRKAPGSRPLSGLLPPDAADFVGQLLRWSPQKRISAGNAIYHKFILGV